MSAIEGITAGVLTHKRLIELFTYTDFGIFIRNKKTSNVTKEGEIAGSRDAYGYIVIGIDGKYYKAHRLAWFYVHVKWPKNQIDHINSIKHDNRINNLREATPAENCIHHLKRKDNSSGFVGIHWDEKKRKWIARCAIDNIRYYLGAFKDKEIAIEKYTHFAKLHHGEFYSYGK